MMKPILAVAGGVFFIALLIGGFVVYRVLTRGRPLELSFARVVSGADQFSKQAFYRGPDVGVITDIKERQKHRLVVVGQRGAAFLTEQGAAERRIRFEKCRSDVTAVDFEDGAFLCRGAWTIDTILFDSTGKTLWSYSGGANGIDDAAAGIIGASGSTSVVVGFNGDGGVHLLSSEGKELWKQEDGNVWHVEIAAADDKCDNVILHSNAAGQLTIRDANGNVLARYNPDIYLAHFSLTAWNDDPHLNKLIATDEGFVHIMTMEGKTVARLPAPGDAGIAETKGTPVRFSSGPPYYASILRFSQWSRALFYIYNDQKQLVYDEILGDECAALHAVPGKNGTEDLLVGCDGVVWKYSTTKQPPEPK